MAIVIPPKIYLDSNHLIEIAKLRAGEKVREGSEKAYRYLDSCLKMGEVGLIFFPGAVLDWVDGNATLETASEIAQIVDSASLQYEIEADRFVYLHELQAELRRLVPNIKLPDFEVFFQRIPGALIKKPLGTLAQEAPSYLPDNLKANVVDGSLPPEVEIWSATKWVEDTMQFKAANPTTYQKRVDEHRQGYLESSKILKQRGGEDFDAADLVRWAKQFVRIDRTITALNPDLNREVDSLLAQMDMDNCPAVSTFARSSTRKLQSGDAYKDNDSDDWAFVHVVPYADFVLTEKSLRHFICLADKRLTAKVFDKPIELQSALEQWLEG